MGAIESASRSLRTLLGTPTLFLAAAVFGLLKLPVEAFRVSWLYWLLALATFLFTPVVLAGLYGLAAEALDDDGESAPGQQARQGGRPSTDAAGTPPTPDGRPPTDDAGGRPERDGRPAPDEASGNRPKPDGRTPPDAADGSRAKRRDGGTAAGVGGDSADVDPPRRRPFRDGVADGYLNLLAANVLYAVLQYVVLVVFLVAAAAVGAIPFGAALAVETMGDGGRTLVGGLGLLALVVVALVAGVYVVVRTVLLFFLQLYKPATVVGDAGPLEAFAESYRLVRANPRSAAGFVLLRGFAFLVFLLPGVAALTAFVAVESTVFEQFVGEEPTLLRLGVVVLAFGVGVVQLAFLGTYRVAFYRELADGVDASDGTGAAD